MLPGPVFVWVALGSALGGLGRYWCVMAVDTRIGGDFPWGTLAVNVLGSFAIGIIATLMAPEDGLFAGAVERQFLMIGVLGGFTTFSAFSLQTLNLLQDGHWLSAAGYILASVIACLLGVWLGHVLALAANN